MRRTRLIWFALGAGAAAVISVFASLFLQTSAPEHEQTAFIVLTEPISDTNSVGTERAKDEEMIANKTGKILRDCDAKIFETTFLYNDHAPTAEFPIIPENFAALECVVNAIHMQKIAFTLEKRNTPRAAIEYRAEK